MEDFTSTVGASASKGVYHMDPEFLYLSADEAARIGQAYAPTYQSGSPYHHICIDDFLPASVAEQVRAEALAQGEKEAQFSSAQEHLKTSYNPDTLPLYTRSVFNALNSRPFLRFLEEMTGIKGLIPDPYYLGAGIHRTNNGGYLGIHADFNYHKRMNLERRLNLLIYLNPDWKPEYGGAFEVWTDDMKEQVAAFPPQMNRMCCFSTSSTSMHGNPEPVNHPDGNPRISIALYYYTSTWSDDKVAHSTLFRSRPGTDDKDEHKAHRLMKLKRYTPPAFQPFMEKVVRKLRLV
jgi:Rps23 Pro-64 3,4-dihydroxylase Tpa1-like proline 4-hydroxylase